MKITKYLALAFAGLFAFTSCQDDEETSLGAFLTVTEAGTGSTGGAITITQGETLSFAIDARKGDSDMETFAISISGVNTVNPIPTSLEGNTFPYNISNADDETYIDTVIFVSAGANLGNTVYTFTVTDKDGNTDVKTFTVTVDAGTTPLSSATAFTWERVAGNPATGLSQFGLKWTSNSSTSAIVALDAGTKMVELTPADWSSITTQEDLASAISSGTSVTEYRGVSSSANGTYDDVLGVSYNGENFILNITQGTVSTSGAGTTITINGESKK
tara:strand:- start:8307 stop:9128 length:822 start_codon:yes stop_codon:yes gene_type:complete